MTDNILLEMKRITKKYPGVIALDDVSFNLLHGEIHALVGENGAGKSTLIKALMGIVKKDEGEIFIEGKKVSIKDPLKASHVGVSAVFQELSQVPHMTVAENVFLGKESNVSKILLSKKKMLQKTNEILEKYNITEIKGTDMIADLPMAKRQLAEIVKAVSVKPKILILDEPTSALTENETAKLFKIVNDFKKEGIGIIYISHRMNELELLADRMTVLRDGKYVDTVKMADVTMQEVVKMMVNRDVELHDKSKEVRKVSEERILEVKNISKKGMFKDISFSLKKGEILGIAGLMGSGRSELMRLIFGIDTIDSGEIVIEGKPVKINCVEDAINNGIAMVPESRQLQGLVLMHTIQENLTLPVLKSFSKAGIQSKKKMKEFAKKNIEEFGIKTESENKVAGQLSGGNQQKIVIAKWLAANPKILIIDEPTVGIDINSKTEIHKTIRNLSESGLSVILISSEMPEVLSHSDRVLIMNDFKIIADVLETTQNDVMYTIMQDKAKNKEA